MANERYVVEIATGRLGKVPADAVLPPEYYRDVDSPEDVQAAETKVVAENQKATAAAEGVLRVATFGGADAFVRNFGNPEELERVQARSKTGAATVGEVAGYGLTALAGGGLFGAAKGATGLATSALASSPAALAVRGAAVAGERVAAGVAARGGSQMLARGAGLATEGLVEGAAFGAGQTISEQSLADQDLTAEYVLSGAGSGAFFGGLGGGVLGAGLGKLADRGARRAAAAVDNVPLPGATVADDVPLPGATVADDVPLPGANTIDEAVGPGPERGSFELPDGVANTMAKLSGVEPSTIKQTLGGGDSAQRLRQNWLQRVPKREEHVKALTSNIEEMASTERLVRDAFSGDLKAANIAATVKRAPETIATAQAYAQKLKAQVYENIQANRVGIGKTDVAGMRQWVDDLVEKTPADEAELMAAIDKTRRAMFTWTKKADAIKTNSPQDTIANQAVAVRLREIAEDARAFLIDPDVWGQAARTQERRNAAGTAFFDTATDWQARFFRQTGELDDVSESLTRKKRLADPKKVDAYVDGITDYRNSIDHVSTAKSVRTRREMLDALLENGDIPADKIADFKRARESTLKFERTLDDAHQTMSDINLAMSAKPTDAGAGGIVGSVLGSFALGPVGAIAGAAGGLANPYNVMRSMAVVESLAQRTGRVRKSADAIGGFIRRAGEATPAILRKSEGRKRLGRAARAAVVVAAVGASAETFGRTPKARREKFDRVAADIREQTTSPEASVRRARYITDGIAGVAPAVSAAIAMKRQAAVQYLASKLPQPATIIGRSIQPHLDKSKASDAEIARFARIATTVADPFSVLKDLKSGVLRREQVEALRDIYPGVYREIQASALDALSRTTKPLPYQMTLQLSLLLDIPGHPSLTPEFIASQQASQASPEEQPGGEQSAPAPTPTTPTRGLNQTVAAARGPMDRINALL